MTLRTAKGERHLFGSAPTGRHFAATKRAFVNRRPGAIRLTEGCPECDCPVGREIAAWVLVADRL